MEIVVHIENRQPLSGSVTVKGKEAKPFAGWLQLLRILSEALSPELSSPARDLNREFDT